jgi:hypothetical protein
MVPAERLQVVLGGLSSKHLKYFGADLADVQLRADDLDWTFGSGRPLSGHAQDLLLAVCGRTLPTGHLQGVRLTKDESPGDGVEELGRDLP